LHDRLSLLGASLISDALKDPENLRPRVQPEDGVTYASKIDKAEARVDWSRPAVEVDRLIRGLSPFPGAWTDVDGERIKLLRSRVVEGAGAPGTVLDGFRIACGTGAVEVLQAQRAGKKAMVAADILRGLALPERLT
ncbi:MAG: methionyl-tRNA formyltransferase, partial [Pseudomonadota bacterium]